MPFVTKDTFTFDHTAQGDYPNWIPSVTKTNMNARSEELRLALNAVVNLLNATGAGVSGAKNVAMTPIASIGSQADVQTVVEALITRLQAVTASVSGAKFIGVETIVGLTGNDVQVLLSALKTLSDGYNTAQTSALTTHKTSADHNGTYFTETELGATTGAELVGATAPSGLTGTTVQALINALKTTVDNVVLGQIPDGSLTDIKLSNTAGQIKDTVTAHFADYVRQPGYINPTGGTSTAYTGSTTPTLSAYSEGVGLTIIPHVDCGASPTFAWGALAATPLLKQDGTAYGALEMLAGKPYSFKKVGTSFLADSSGAFKVTGQTEETIELAETISIYDPIYVDLVTLAKLANPATLPTGSGVGVTFSADGVYMTVGHATTPFVTTYKRSGDVFTKLADPATLPTGTGFGVAFSADGVYMTVAHGTTPFVTIYKRAGDVFTKLADPATLPTGSGGGVAFSADGVYMTVGHATTPFITTYKRAGDVFTKLADPATLPTGAGYGTAFSADGVYMTVAHGTTPFVTTYKRAGDVFTKLADPATLPTGLGYGVAFSADGVYMTVAHDVTPFVTIYKRAGDVFTKLANPATLPTGTSGYGGVAFSADGVYMTIGHGVTPFVTIYKRAGDVFTKLADPATLPTGTGYGVAFSADGVYMTVGHGTTPFVTIYKYTFKAFRSIVSRVWLDKIRLGYAKESGVTGDLRKVIITHR